MLATMTTYDVPDGFEPFLAAAADTAAARPEMDVDVARELMAEAATMLHDGLVVDHLDEHDRTAVIAGLAAALTDPDPAAAVLAAVETDLATLHDPQGAEGAYLAAAAVLRL